jgi:hypothetical protein
VAIGIGLWLAWSIIANAAADNLAASDPEAALAWRGDRADALVVLANRNITSDARLEAAGEIQSLAERALLMSPLNDDALAILGLLADSLGNQERADRLMGVAAARSYRHGYVQVWSFYRQARLGNFEAAVAHADALLRTRPELRGEIAPTLVAFAIDPEAKEPLVRLLAELPPWRGWYLGELAAETDDPGIAYAVYAELKSGANPPTDAELRVYLDKLVSSGKFEQAYLTWINFLPAERQRSISYAYNGDFEYPVSNLPFDWTIRPIAGASTDVVATGAEELGDAVRVEFANRRVPYRHLSKLLMLPPGTYRLTGMAKAENLDNDRGLIWRLTCAEIDKQALGETKPVKGTVEWHQFAVSFLVPQSGCRAQWLTVTLPARVALEEEIGGVVWFDNLTVERDEQRGNGLDPT